MKVKATHYIQIKEVLEKDKEGKPTKFGKDLLVLRRGDEKSLNKKEAELVEKEAAGKYKVIEENK